ncbi:M23 family metallopeptidase [Sphingomonas desiccabilis]|uniref:M23 family metallopeptidase n=1 Tax=Sphingomonas desiccabilis TaxID=429134 RepID=A0A4V1QP15_9SPHN|nr:M23 family metallopeptidase [Sphingomonas desiccabilis]MBB3911684.1 murein DD-endopeptidase MepM/ murein hydrolase activator NlpD [Sphingomonas desiccabilis]RXZ31584.1 M23 family metallopeptidase [Sphingomonas desiccabilis]
MFLRSDHELQFAGGASARSFGRMEAPARAATLGDRLQLRFPHFELAPDLGSQIGSREWWRGAATCAALLAAGWMLSPGLGRPIRAAVPAALDGRDWEEARAQAFGARALGATSGMRMAATAGVRPLADTPERPILELTATLGNGGGLAVVLKRSGVGAEDAARAVALIGSRVSPGELNPGTRLDITLGRRETKSQPRPLEKLAFRARFDLALELARAEGGLALKPIPIAIDHTPLRVQGRVGSSLYHAARAAGAPAKAVEAYIKSLSTRVPMGRVGGNDRFDIIIERRRAETGEVQLGKLLYAGLDQGRRSVRLLRWEEGSKVQWYDPKGIGERRGGMTMPINGRLTSNFGWRVHPLLRFRRLHKGLDIAAPTGTPIRAAADGVVARAGRAGGYGNFVKLNHSGGLATGYGHMSRIAVRAGQRVRQGSVIGYVGSTGISTGPHLHYELWKNGAAVNPRSVSLASVQQLSGEDLRRFKATYARLMAVPTGAAKAD